MFANRMRSLLPKINRISGGLLVLAAVYLVLYGWFQKDPLNNGNGVIDYVEGIQADVVNYINNDLGAERAGLIMLLVVGVLAASAFTWKFLSNRSSASGSGSEPEADVEIDAEVTELVG